MKTFKSFVWMCGFMLLAAAFVYFLCLIIIAFDGHAEMYPIFAQTKIAVLGFICLISGAYFSDKRWVE